MHMFKREAAEPAAACAQRFLVNEQGTTAIELAKPAAK
jgi:hypothetical protein